MQPRQSSPSIDKDLRTSIEALLAVAARSSEIRDWYPADPEMNKVRGTDLVPEAMTPTEKKKPEPEVPEPDDATMIAIKAIFKDLGRLAE